MTRLHIDTLTLQAEGVGRLDGRVVFVPGGLPGETLEVQLVEEKKNFSRGRLVRILETSPERITPPCPYFGDCGGCQLQHLEAAAQDRFKQTGFQTALSHALKQDDLPRIPLLESPSRLHYRHRLRLKLGEAEGRTTLGFYGARSHRIIPIRQCLLAQPLVNEILAFLQQQLTDLPVSDKPLDLEIQSLGIAGKGIVLITTGTFLPNDQRDRIGEKLKEFPGIKAVFFQTHPGGLLTGTTDFAPEDHSLIYRVPFGHPSLPTEALSLACFPQVFSQVNLVQNLRLIDLLLGQPLMKTGDAVWDLFCGQGNFSFPLALKAGRVIGVESSQPAVDNAKFNQAVHKIDRCRFIRDQARSGLSRLIRAGERPDWVLLDPPRAGAREIIPALDSLNPKGIYYVSCDPMTLFRDLGLFLTRGWKLDWCRPLDFFPQTFHLESLSLLRK